MLLISYDKGSTQSPTGRKGTEWQMFYKLIIDEQGNIEVVDRVDHAKKNDGYIYATEKEFALLNKRIVFNYNDEVKDIC